MAKASMFSAKALRATIYLLLLAVILKCANSARILDDVDLQAPVIDDTPQLSNPAATTVLPTTLPSGQFPATTPAFPPEENHDSDQPLPEEAEAPIPETPLVTDEAPVVSTPATTTATVANAASTTGGPTITSPTGTAAVTAASATVANPGSQDPPLSFFMHDILGGSHPSARVVTGIIAKTEINGIPFSKANSNIFSPFNGGTPLVNPNNLNNIINENNIPFLTGLNGAQPNTVLQNTANNNVFENEDNQPFVSAGQLPPGSSLQKLMFGTITVIDDELTEGHELGSGVIGRAQGFYLASSLDGTSQTIALTALFHGGEHEHQIEDTISFFGVHRTVSHDSQIAVVGGTGKYEHAKGYATLETLHQEDQHTTDGVDTMVKFSVYITYEN